jgi:hypothetical protein
MSFVEHLRAELGRVRDGLAVVDTLSQPSIPWRANNFRGMLAASSDRPAAWLQCIAFQNGEPRPQ